MRPVDVIRRILVAAVVACLSPGSAAAAGQVLLIGKAPDDVVGLTRLWTSLEKGLGFSDVRIAVAGSPHEIADNLRQFLGAPGTADDLRLVWIAGSGADAATSVCPSWNEEFVRPQVPTILVAPTCVKFLVQAPSTYEQIADADPTAPIAGPPGVVFLSTTSAADDDPAELLAALTGSATPQGDEAAARALVAALTCPAKGKLSADFSPSSSAWHIAPPLCPQTEVTPDASAQAPAPAGAEDAPPPAATASLPYPPPPRPDPEDGSSAVPQMPAVPPVPVATAPLPEAGAPSFAEPVDGKVVADFGSPVAGKPNKGVDFEVPAGSPVKAAESGEVVYVGRLPGYGDVVAIKHGNDWATVYGHTSDIGVTKGQMVTKGQDIAHVDPAANRLHFEVRRRGKPVDPRPMMASAGQ